LIEPNSLGEVVDELDSLLNEETEALRLLNHESLNEITDRKVHLLRRLELCRGQKEDQELGLKLKGVRERVLMNQVLMVHARDLSQGVIDTLRPHQAHVGGARLFEVRG